MYDIEHTFCCETSNSTNEGKKGTHKQFVCVINVTLQCFLNPYAGGWHLSRNYRSQLFIRGYVT